MTATPLMRRAIEIAARGFPSPNPHVGCVIAQNNEIVGEGWHEFAGGPHAEIMALNQAGPRAKGADVYVTLEPCNHTGRTGPCSLALVQAGVRSVHYAVADPNLVAAGGAQTLASAGIQTAHGDGAVAAREVNRVWLYAQSSGLPYICVKVATTQDGFLAKLDGTSKWITGEDARRVGHRLRAEMGAVLVGINTLLADDPALTARIEGIRNQPMKIVLDPNGRATGREQVWRNGRTIHVVASNRHSHGEALSCELGNDGTFDLTALSKELRSKGITGILVEGGAQTIQSFFYAGLVQEFHRFIAPIEWIEGIPWVQEAHDLFVPSSEWHWLTPTLVGQDRHDHARRIQSIGTDRSC